MLTCHSHVTLVAHIVWSTHQRRRLLPSETDAWMSQRLRGQSQRVDVELLEMGCSWDHVHVVLRWGATQKLCDVVKSLKGGTSRFWNLEQVALEALTWQEGYWAESVSPKDLDALLVYVRNQRRHHANNPSMERWELALHGLLSSH